MADDSSAILVTYDRLKERYWQYSHDGGMVAPDAFFFNQDGTIGNNTNKNERYWEINDGILSFLSDSRSLTVRFEHAFVENDKLVLKGDHLPKRTIRLCLKELKPMSARPQNNPTRNALLSQINRFGWKIGEHSYGVPGFLEVGRSKLVIGKYCSIAGGVTMSFGDHNTGLPSTFPFGAFSSFWPHLPKQINHHLSKGDVVIGNDVWIGSDAFIGSGVTIGDGAVIGANAVVTKNVPPYGIVVGNSARIVRYRFPQDIIDEMLMLKWWDLEDEQVDALLPVMFSADLPAFLAALRAVRGVSAAPFMQHSPTVAPPVAAVADGALGAHYELFDPAPRAPLTEPAPSEPESAPGVLKRFQKLVGL